MAGHIAMTIAKERRHESLETVTSYSARSTAAGLSRATCRNGIQAVTMTTRATPETTAKIAGG
jgi:hypothetical protein